MKTGNEELKRTKEGKALKEKQENDLIQKYFSENEVLLQKRRAEEMHR